MIDNQLVETIKLGGSGWEFAFKLKYFIPNIFFPFKEEDVSSRTNKGRAVFNDPAIVTVRQSLKWSEIAHNPSKDGVFWAC